MSGIKVTIGHSKSKAFINIYFNKNRYRYWNGKIINMNIKSTENPQLLKAAFELKIRDGWTPSQKKKKVDNSPKTVIEALNRSVEIKTAQGCSKRFIKDAKRIITLWKIYEKERQKKITIDELNIADLKSFLIRSNWSSKTQRTVKSTLSPLLNEFRPNLVNSIKLKKPISSMHKPFENIKDILLEIKNCNENLYLCALLTYGCLLRPHREIRELCWADFSEDLTSINLSGHRNKSGRNRIVPVPKYIRDYLVKGEPLNNIFTGRPKAFNEDYFKTLWSRYKKQSELIDNRHTLYSFRHSGAINIFKRTGSLAKLQKAMGHSSMNVSLTYLRGLEIGDLKEEDMPILFF